MTVLGLQRREFVSQLVHSLVDQKADKPLGLAELNFPKFYSAHFFFHVKNNDNKPSRKLKEAHLSLTTAERASISHRGLYKEAYGPIREEWFLTHEQQPRRETNNKTCSS